MRSSNLWGGGGAGGGGGGILCKLRTEFPMRNSSISVGWGGGVFFAKNALFCVIMSTKSSHWTELLHHILCCIIYSLSHTRYVETNKMCIEPNGDLYLSLSLSSMSTSMHAIFYQPLSLSLSQCLAVKTHHYYYFILIIFNQIKNSGYVSYNITQIYLIVSSNNSPVAGS